MNIEELYNKYSKTYKVSTDTRNIEQDSIFFALKGANFNGNKFALQAIEKGASIAVIDEKEYFIEGKTFYTEDVLSFLQKFANYHRKKLKSTIISITGSNGKTTSKELLYSVLRKKYNILATKGNLNNHIGVPLTLLSITPDFDMAIVEMGANHQGEIAELCKIAMPEYGYITNFGKAHLEGFGGVEGVIKGKTELYRYLSSTSGTVFINPDDPIQIEKSIGINQSLLSEKVYFEGANPFVMVNNNGQMIRTNLIGDYNFQNIRAAISIGEFFGVDKEEIKDALEEYTPNNNRSQIIKRDSNTVILDAYNANPTSMSAAIKNLAEMQSDNKVAILGDMFELGEYAKEEHQKLVDELENSEFDKVYVIGELFNSCEVNRVKKYSDREKFTNDVDINDFSYSTILIKGSRGMKLEELVK